MEKDKREQQQISICYISDETSTSRICCSNDSTLEVVLFRLVNIPAFGGGQVSSNGGTMKALDLK